MRRAYHGFSLVEVVIAVGVVAAGVATILALLPVLLRQSEESTDLQTALRLPDAIENKLTNQMAGVFPNGMQNGTTLVANKDGTNVRSGTLADTYTASEQQPTFYITVSAVSAGELAYQSNRPVLPLQVQVYWPYSAVKAAGGVANGGNFQSVSYFVTLAP
jgi:uncharacterized protein (TIGR02598 family)|uniref:prepilin-type N-terminal cleavage/methylation domain-containing protein n=1 Tax=Cephaloticoccus sp. TaxID=1985742 RepID=UPI004048ED35